MAFWWGDDKEKMLSRIIGDSENGQFPLKERCLKRIRAVPGGRYELKKGEKHWHVCVLLLGTGSGDVGQEGAGRREAARA